MKAQCPGSCSSCGGPVFVGDKIHLLVFGQTPAVKHEDCPLPAGAQRLTPEPKQSKGKK